MTDASWDELEADRLRLLRTRRWLIAIGFPLALGLIGLALFLDYRTALCVLLVLWGSQIGDRAIQLATKWESVLDDGPLNDRRSVIDKQGVA